MKEHSSQGRGILAAIALVLLTAQHLNAADVRFFIAAKGQRWMQTNAGPTVPTPGSNHVFTASAEPGGPETLTNAWVTPPGGTPFSLAGGPPGTEGEFERIFASGILLDAAYPNGSYAFVTAGVNDGFRTNALSITGNTYPATPLFKNFAGAQAIDPALDFALGWEAISGATPNDFIQVEIEDCQGDHIVSTPPPGTPGALSGAATNFLIRARTLRPGQQYKVKFLVAHFTTFDTNSYAGATGIGGYFKELFMPLTTTGTPVGCPPGRLAMVFNVVNGGMDGTNGVVSLPQNDLTYSLQYETRGDTNPPATITFSGPGGSGLSNTTNSQRHADDWGAWFSSPPIALPPFPPGGLYTVNYAGDIRSFSLLDPQAGAQQVFLLPTVVVDGETNVVEIRWHYADTNSGTISAPSFVVDVSLSLQTMFGPLYQSDFGGMPIPGTSSSHVLAYPVPWDLVNSVQMSFRDPTRNTYLSTFNRGSEPPPSIEIVTQTLPPGNVGRGYNFQIQANGGLPPYLWTLHAGTLPPGLFLNSDTGGITGSPSEAGTREFVVRATDTTDAFAERSYVIGISGGGGGTNGPDVRMFALYKGQGFMQPGPGAPLLETNEPFHFEAFVEGSSPGSVTNVVLRSPKGTNYVLETEQELPNAPQPGGGDGFEDGGDTFRHSRNFATKGALDNVFNGGSYTFQIGTLNNSNRTVGLNLPGDAYPATPHVSNWPAAQVIDAFSDFTLTWDSLSGATTNDFVLVEIEDESGKVFGTGGPREIGSLNGKATSVLIPANTLAPGQSYKGHVLLGRMVTINTNGYPGAIGFAAYAKATFFPVQTLTPPPPQGQLQFGATTFSISETGEVASFTVTRTGGTEGAVSVDFTTSDGSALGDLDYAPTTGPLEFADGETEVTFTFPVFNDDVFETNETVRLALSNPTGGATLGLLTNAFMVITDNDEPGTAGLLQFSVVNVVVGETGPTVTLTVTRTDGKAGEVTVEYSTGDGSAEGEFDYAPTIGTLTFPANVTSQTFTIGIVSDTIDETNETFEVRLDSPGGGASLGTKNVATVSITDNDTGGEIRLSASAYRFSETNEEAVITIARSGGTASGVTVDVIISDLTATGGEDYTASIETVEFEAGATTASFSILLNDDSIPEGDETFRIDLSNATGGGVLGRGTNAIVTIVDDEESLQFNAEAYTVSEGASAVVLTVIRSGPATGAVTVDYQTVGGSAESDEDFFGTNGTITFGPGVKSRTLTVRLVRDDAVEEDETFGVELGSPVGAQLGTVTEAVVNITDDDEGGAINFKTAGFTVKENAPFAIITVTRTGGDASGVSFDLATADGSTEEGDDYTGVSETFEFEAGANSMRIVIPIVNDAFDETNETVHLTLSNPTGGATLGALSEANLTIVDNDTGGVIAFSAVNYSVTETGTTAVVTLTRSSGVAGGVSVDFITGGGTATPDEDYTAITNTYSFESNQTRLLIEIDIANDDLPDGNETVLMNLSNPAGGARLGSRTNAVLAILDDEKSVQFTNVAFTVIEGVRNAIITVKRSGSLKGAITVDYATGDETATAGSDYTARSGTLSFSSGSSAKTIIIPLLNDTADEADETFTITLSNPSEGVQLGENETITVTIQDNDPAPRVVRAPRR